MIEMAWKKLLFRNYGQLAFVAQKKNEKHSSFMNLSPGAKILESKSTM